jgi:hypothetical protein
MEPQLAAPGMENTVKSNSGPQAFRILPEFQEGMRSAFKQQVIHDPSVESAQGIENIGQCENAVVIGDRKQFVNSGSHPFAPGDIVATWAMAVSAGVVSFFKMAACVADLPVGAELSASAVLNIVHNLVLPGMQSV